MAREIGELLKEKRELATLTQIEAAERLGITQSKLSKLENGHFNSLPVGLALRLSDLYDIPVETLAERRTA